MPEPTIKRRPSPTQIRIPDDLKAELQQIAEYDNRSLAQLILLVLDGFAAYDPYDPPALDAFFSRRPRKATGELITPARKRLLVKGPTN